MRIDAEEVARRAATVSALRSAVYNLDTCEESPGEPCLQGWNCLRPVPDETCQRCRVFAILIGQLRTARVALWRAAAAHRANMIPGGDRWTAPAAFVRAAEITVATEDAITPEALR